jgi:hypothetical protein
MSELLRIRVEGDANEELSNINLILNIRWMLLPGHWNGNFSVSFYQTRVRTLYVNKPFIFRGIISRHAGRSIQPSRSGLDAFIFC